ncbi:MAG: glycosyltransferase family 2 protein [Candidatus Saccharimonadales bacterium]
MKVIVQIPCYNEEQTLPLVLESIPKKIKGVDSLEVLIIDDGSTDKTIEVAKKFGVQHFIYHRRNMGLARGFQDGANLALELGADILVSTDGDNQYPQEKIPDLIQPIIDGRAEIVVADRQTAKIAHFSPLKKALQKFGSYMVNKAAGTDLPDAASGFRAYSRLSLLRLNVITKFSYCMETIIQAGNKRLAITSIPVKTNLKTRESRLFKNMWQHVFMSMSAIVRAYIMYKPRVVFSVSSGAFLLVGLVPFIRFLVLAGEGNSSGHLQSLIIGAVLIFIAFLLAVLGVVADLIHINRILLEENLEHTKRNRLKE